MAKKTPIDQKIQNFIPKCLEREGRNVGRAVAVTATGFVLPCCWLDDPISTRDKKVSTLFDDKLHVDNNDTIEDIINSNPWQKFIRELVEKPEESSPICLKMCTISGRQPMTQKKKWR